MSTDFIYADGDDAFIIIIIIIFIIIIIIIIIITILFIFFQTLCNLYSLSWTIIYTIRLCMGSYGKYMCFKTKILLTEKGCKSNV